MDLEKQFEIAIAAIKNLDELHKQFMKQIGALNTPEIEGMELRETDGELQLTCLSYKFIAKRRPVAANGFFTAIEYSLKAIGQSGEVTIADFYLQGRSRDLTSDYAGTDMICQSGNTYLPDRLGPWVCAQIMNSELCSPHSASDA